VQTIDRAFAVLRALAARPGTSTLSDVAREAGLPKSTVSRLLGALEEQAAVQALGGRWALGPGLTTLTHQAAPVSALRELARPDLVDLAEAFGENASLAIADDDAALAAGVRFAATQCRALLTGGAPGLHFYTLNRFKATLLTIKRLDP